MLHDGGYRLRAKHDVETEEPERGAAKKVVARSPDMFAHVPLPTEIIVDVGTLPCRMVAQIGPSRTHCPTQRGARDPDEWSRLQSR